MQGMDSRQHVLLTQELVVVLLGLGIETRIVIGIPGVSGSTTGRGRRAQDGLVDAADAAAASADSPAIVALARIGVAPPDEAGTTDFIRRKDRVQAKQPVAARGLKIRIDRRRLDFGTAHQVVAHIVADLKVLDLLLLRASALVA